MSICPRSRLFVSEIVPFLARTIVSFIPDAVVCLFFFLVFLFSLFSSPFASGYICPFFPRCVNTSCRFNDFSFHTLTPSNPLAIFIHIPHCIPIHSQTFHPNSPFAFFPLLSPLKPILPSLPLGSTSAPPNTFIMGSFLVPHKFFFSFFVAGTATYKSPCRSVGWSVGRSICYSLLFSLFAFLGSFLVPHKFFFPFFLLQRECFLVTKARLIVVVVFIMAVVFMITTKMVMILEIAVVVM